MPAGTDPQDIFQNGQWFSRGGLPVTQSILAQSAIPVIIPSSSATGIQANGTVTLDTALPQTYARSWCYFPANAVSGDATGGLYYCVFTSATAGTVYLPKVGGASGVTSTFIPAIGSTTTAAVGSAAAYTQSTSTINLVSVSVPGGALGPNGSIRWVTEISSPSNANNKTVSHTFGGTSLFGNGVTTNSYARMVRWLANRGVQNSQHATTLNLTFAASSALITPLTVDTSTTQNLVTTGALAVATDFVIIEFINYLLMPG